MCLLAFLLPAPATAAGSTQLTVTPTADSYVHSLQKPTNFGSSWSLGAYGSPDVESLLRFSLPAAPAGQVLSAATLRVRTTSLPAAGSADTQQAHLAGDSWLEPTVTWNTKPAITSTLLGTLTRPSAVSTSYDIPLDPSQLRPLLGAPASMALLGTGSDGFWFTSRESTTATARPALTLTFSTTSDTTPPSPPAGLTASVNATTVSLSWTASSDNTAVTQYDVHRSEVDGFTPNEQTLIGTSSTTAYTDPTRPAGTTYYRVVAQDAGGNASPPSEQATAVVAGPPAGTTVMAFGDAACPPGSAVTASACRQADVARVVTAAAPDYLVALGDLQYSAGSYSQFTGAGAWDATFGTFRSRTLPALGNHEYTDPSGRGEGYFDYFYGPGVQQGSFGTRPDGYYSKTIGAWQFIALNTECAPDVANANHALTGGCGVGSPQYQWLANVLASSTAKCTLVAFHRPRWTTGVNAPYAPLSAMWDLMARSGVDVILSGHNHDTEIFKRIGPSGNTNTPVLDPAGIRSFVVGTGGKSLSPFPSGTSAVRAALQARDSTTFGALRLSLHDSSFDWSFRPVAGKTYTGVGTTGAFSGTGEPCH